MLRTLCASLLALSGPGNAEVPDELAYADLNVGWRDGPTHVAGLTIHLAPGWKTYWRVPGEAGIPPAFNWSGSSNVAAVRVHFPVPRVFEQGGIRGVGYVGQVTFPLSVRTHDASAPVRLRGDIDIGVCKEVCVPVTLQVRAELPVHGSPDHALAALLEDRPESGGRLSCEFVPIADGLRLVARTTLPRLGSEETVVVETGDPQVWVSPPVLQRDGEQLQAEVEMVPPSARPFALARSEVRMTVLSEGRAIEMVGCH